MSPTETRNKLKDADQLAMISVTKSFATSSGSASTKEQAVLDNLDFSISSGQVVGLIGETGVGKTTLGKIIGGLLRPDSGEVMAGEVNLLNLSPGQTRQVRRWVRYVPQNPDAVLPMNVTVAETFNEARQCSRLNSSDLAKWQELIDGAALCDPAWTARDVGDLSLGQRRRIVNIRSLLSGPRFIILDEPFNGLDLVSKTSMLNLLKSIARERRSGVLIISHDQDALRSSCDNLWEMSAGSLAQEF